MQIKLLSAVLALVLLGSLAGCKTNTASYNEQNVTNQKYLGRNENRQFENGYTSNNPLDKSGLP